MKHACPLAALLLGGLVAISTACAQAPADTQPATRPADAGTWRGITVDREARTIDLDARVVLREGEWLELIACTPGTREHEALVIVAAKPSNIHLALLSLGLEPGKPLHSRMEGEERVIVPPTGPAVEAFFVLDREGEKVEVPVNEWVVDQKNGTPLPSNRFLFTGSAFVPYEGKEVYMADLEGSVLTIVNFGDDLLSRDTTQTNQTDDGQWGAKTDAIPPLGTRVLLRLRAVAE